jgi:AcrR family transcriptional regulator
VDTPAKHLPADERRAVTVEAVIALAGSQNPSEISTSAIAKYMNLTQGALFRHFPSKDAIWEAVMAWVAERLMSKMEAAAAGSTTHLAALEAMFMSHVDFVIEHPGVPRMMFGEMQRAEPTAAKRMAQTLMQRYGEMLCQRLKLGQDEGEIAADINVQAAATLFIGSIQGLVMQSMLSGDISKIRQAAPGVFAIYLRGISCITNIASIKGAR